MFKENAIVKYNGQKFVLCAMAALETDCEKTSVFGKRLYKNGKTAKSATVLYSWKISLTGETYLPRPVWFNIEKTGFIYLCDPI